ncbi:transcription initiation factor IIF, beta subunit-domain-containing protein [Durotheca rogersii]|uniref:transcription initiation factor IIF, beta subunit-domain-containing protein n=1 Tax=Durotheca rogersii TaxID=419775 RepID=UPI0022204D06|nr:transcription initiation factor IIF, beta subunit-domain-containing protein [Durotheca rogersii]KAI5868686.1 transcription initiation factor IIF, beta subunit-domain-containing protein [Durotheca rogersii]
MIQFFDGAGHGQRVLDLCSIHNRPVRPRSPSLRAKASNFLAFGLSSLQLLVAAALSWCNGALETAYRYREPASWALDTPAASSMAAPRVKAEPSIKPEPTIKAEPDDAGVSPAAMSEDDIYEDAGDLEFYDPNDIHAGSVYLTHVPKYLYDAWSHLDDDAEIRIGTVRQWNEPGQNGQMKQRISMLIDHRISQHQSVPKEYNLDVKDMQLTNTFLFTEQDLPGYKSKSQGVKSDIPAFLRPKPERPREEKKPEENNKGGRKGRYQPYYRKAIPKKTVLAGRFRHELNCQPVWTEETKHLLSIRNTDAMKPRATTTLTSAAKPTGLIQAGAHVSNDKFGNFIRAAAPETKKAKKQGLEKTTRLPKSELRDQLFKCFEKYSYWPMKALKQTLQQPEAWLRENLEEVAVLHKTGSFANHWELNPDHKAALNILGVEDAAPDDAPEGDESEEEEMEDVVPT